MEQNEIIKALECCGAVDISVSTCDRCPFEPKEEVKGSLGCNDELIRNALALIKELTEENERLNIEVANSVVAKQDENKYIAQIKQLTAENKRLSSEKEIILINKVICEAVIHGADAGGSYDSNEDGLTEAINEWLKYKKLDHLYCVEIRDVRKDFGCRLEIWSVPQICEKTEIKEGENE